MKQSIVPLISFAVAVALSMLTVSPRALARRAPQQATGCTAKATAKSATANVAKFDVAVTDVQVQVDASDSSVLKVSASFGLTGSLELTYPAPRPPASFGLSSETPLKPAAQTKNYSGAVSKLETGFAPFGAPAGTILAGVKKAVDQWKKDRPEAFKGVSTEQVVITKGELNITGSYNCKSGGAGSFTPLSGDVPIDKTGSGKATISQ
jgi:hypothetical protein